jgi:hypothetical protein
MLVMMRQGLRTLTERLLVSHYAVKLRNVGTITSQEAVPDGYFEPFDDLERILADLGHAFPHQSAYGVGNRELSVLYVAVPESREHGTRSVEIFDIGVVAALEPMPYRDIVEATWTTLDAYAWNAVR